MLVQVTSALVRSCKMENVTFVDIENPFDKSVTTHAIIDNGDGSFTSMLKSTYDEMIAKREASTL